MLNFENNAEKVGQTPACQCADDVVSHRHNTLSDLSLLAALELVSAISLAARTRAMERCSLCGCRINLDRREMANTDLATITVVAHRHRVVFGSRVSLAALRIAE